MHRLSRFKLYIRACGSAGGRSERAFGFSRSSTSTVCFSLFLLSSSPSSLHSARIPTPYDDNGDLSSSTQRRADLGATRRSGESTHFPPDPHPRCPQSRSRIRRHRNVDSLCVTPPPTSYRRRRTSFTSLTFYFSPADTMNGLFRTSRRPHHPRHLLSSRSSFFELTSPSRSR